MGWAAGVERILLAAEERPLPEPVVDLYVALAERRRAQRGVPDRGEARRAGVPAQLELAGRSLKGQMKQAGRIGARYVAIVGEDGIELKDMESGEQDAGRLRRAPSSRPCCAEGIPGEHGAGEDRRPRANAYRDSWCGDARRRTTPAARCASPAGCTAAATTAA